MINNLFFTVFTPIYNRKHTIHRVWESLLQQTNQNFEWLIVNDGSEDEIIELLEAYKKKATFNVRIFNQENKGKHVAFNLAVNEAKGELFIPADSDDSFIATTIEEFNDYWAKHGNTSLSGIDVLCMNEENQIIGDVFPNVGISSYGETYFKHKVKGEKWGCVRIDVLKQYKFPEMFESKFFPESFVWSQIGLNYKTLYLNRPLRKYYQDSGNQLINENNRTLDGYKIENFNAVWWLNNMYPALKNHLNYKEILKKFFSLWNTSFMINKSYKVTVGDLDSTKNKTLALMTFLPAFFLVKYKTLNQNSNRFVKI